MAHNDVILSRYEEFDPGTKWLEDKRVLERAVGGFKKLVAKNHAKLAIHCAAIYPLVNKGQFVGVQFVTPEGPVVPRNILTRKRPEPCSLMSFKMHFCMP